MSEYDTVSVVRHDAVAVVSLNRPDQLNSINAELRRDLLCAVREVNNDDTIRAAILTGSGRAFCAGADLTETAANPADFRVDDQLNLEYKPTLLEIMEAPQRGLAAPLRWPVTSR